MKTIVTLAAAAIICLAPAAVAQAPQSFKVTLDPSLPAASGRLLIIARRADPARPVPATVSVSTFSIDEGAAAAREVPHLAPGDSVVLNADEVAFPKALSQLAPGSYDVQAVLDVDRDYAYFNGLRGGDVVSAVTRLQLPAQSPPALTLSRTIANLPRGFTPSDAVWRNTRYQAFRDNAELIQFRSPAVSAFWGREMAIRAWVLLPPGYRQGRERFPVVYWTSGFGGDINGYLPYMAQAFEEMSARKTPKMIWVFLDHGSPSGTHEFADSANNGPWGKALTEELIPHLERTYRMDGRSKGRFLTGHSSGGWASLWLQVRYPRVFGGTWPTAPDPVDFRSFVGKDIYAPNANLYRLPDGSLDAPLMRERGRIASTLKEFSTLEGVLGEVGGQMDSFEWVFSPKGPDGRPLPLYDRVTGVVDPEVAAHWRENYDIGHIVERDWRKIGKDLDGKIHLAVGTADNFYLDEAARLLKARLDKLGARSDFIFEEGRTHFDLGVVPGDPAAMHRRIAWEMHRVARPQSIRPR